MAEHDVTFSVPARPLGKADTDFDVFADGVKLGSFKVSKVSVVWYRQDGPKGYRVSWAKLGELLEAHGPGVERRTRAVS